MTTTKATSEPAYSACQVLRAAERAVLDACVKESRAKDAFDAADDDDAPLYDAYFVAYKVRLCAVRSYRALIEAESK